MKDPDYIEWIKMRPCTVEYCRGKPCDAHHRIGHGRNTEIDKEDPGKRVCDFEAIPLCSAHHTELHTIGWREFEATYHLHQLKLCIKYLKQYIIHQRMMEGCPI